MIIRIIAASVLAKPLNNAQIVRGFFVYTHLYKEGSTFKKVMMLYRFDKKL